MQKRQELCKNGICHLVCEAQLPALPEGQAGERIGALIEDVLALAKKRAEAALPALCERYEQDENPKKHLLHRPLLLSLSCSLCEEERRYCLLFWVRLSRSGRPLSEIKKAAFLDKESGRFLYEKGKRMFRDGDLRRKSSFFKA